MISPEEFIKAKYNLEFTAGDDHIYIEYLEKELKAAWELNAKLVQLKFIGDCFKMLNFIKDQLPPVTKENDLSGITHDNKTDLEEWKGLYRELSEYVTEIEKENKRLTEDNKQMKLISEWYFSLRKNFEDLQEENNQLKSNNKGLAEHCNSWMEKADHARKQYYELLEKHEKLEAIKNLNNVEYSILTKILAHSMNYDIYSDIPELSTELLTKEKVVLDGIINNLKNIGLKK